VGSGRCTQGAGATPKSGIGVLMGGFPWYTNSTISLTNFSRLRGKVLKCSSGPDLLSYRVANLRGCDEKKAKFLLWRMGRIGASFDLHVRMTSQVFQHTAIAENAADRPP
jgi:hypothetical protein